VALNEYRKKRDFGRTPEPRGVVRARAKLRTFVVQQHAASRLHYDFRLEHRGVLLSWAVPKGPSFDPAEKRLAVRVEDHPLDYGGFEGVIPAGQYGAGRVIVWDRGHWQPHGDVDEGLREGKLEFVLEGRKLRGEWTLVRMGGKRAKDEKNWLLIKHRDAFARTGAAAQVTLLEPASVKSGRPIADLASKTSRAPRATRAATPMRVVRSARTGQVTVRAARDPLPDFVAPQLATLVASAPTESGWLFETKFDGYRMLARLQDGRVRWISRNGRDWSDRFDELTPVLARLPAKAALLDGEVVVVRPNGTTSFQGLQRVLAGESSAKLTYAVFDLLHLDGHDLRARRLLERKRLLRELLAHGTRRSPISYSAHVEGTGAEVFVAACRAHLEGVVAKRADAPYRSGRTRDWLKLKCGMRQEFVVVGFTEPQGSRAGFGALALAVHEHGRLRYAGRVGTGFDQARLTDLRRRLDALRVAQPPVAGPLSAAARRGVAWVRPELVAEIAFTGWTEDGLVRQGSFEGLREDKPARDVVRERPKVSARRIDPAARNVRVARARAEEVAGIAITHPDRVLFAEAGITKLELARYYAELAPRILPHVAERPLSVVRCPEGSSGACFFQKHAGPGFPSAVRSVEIRESGGGRARYLTIDSVEGLIALVQMGVIELHPWGSRNDRVDAPDRLFFDLDPAPDVPWRNVAEAALQLRERLAKLDLEAFLKTTGGKGLHVVVPLERRLSWEELKGFSHAVAVDMARSEPKLYIATASKAQRGGRIFIDYLRNARGATAVAAYSARARPNAPVSTPIGWNELDGKVRADTFTVANLRRRLTSKRRDPWADFEGVRQALGARARRATGA
jgi:bifunctional non-homologous end joining protein LigD